MSTARTPIRRSASDPPPASQDLRWTCEEARLWSPAFEVRATVEERTRFQSHLRTCPGCRAFFSGTIPLPRSSRPEPEVVPLDPRPAFAPVTSDLRYAAEPALLRRDHRSAAAWVRIAGLASVLVVVAAVVVAWKALTPDPLPTAVAVEGELSYHPAGDVHSYLLPSVELRPGDEVWCGPLDSGLLQTEAFELRLGANAGIRFQGHGPGGIRALHGDLEILGHASVRTAAGTVQVEGGHTRMLIEDTGVRVKSLEGTAWITDSERATHTLEQGQSIALSLTKPTGSPVEIGSE